MKTIFARNKELVNEIDKYLDDIERGALIFQQALLNYYNGETEKFEERYLEIDEIEGVCDDLRRNIKHKLYSNLLIPDARGDVLGLLETMDNVIDTAKKVASHFSIEKPIIFPFVKNDFVTLTDMSVKAVLDLVNASRAFFREIRMVGEYINKVHFWEHEADKVEEELKRKVFNSEEIEKFSVKIHLRYFAEKISKFADEAESVCERISVYAIKRCI